MLATLFTHPLTIDSTSTIWMMIPLCVSVATAYKTIRVNTLRRLGLQITWLILYMVFGLAALATGFWAVQEILR